MWQIASVCDVHIHVWRYVCALNVLLLLRHCFFFVFNFPPLSSMRLSLTFIRSTSAHTLTHTGPLVPLFLCVGLCFPHDQKIKVTPERSEVSHRVCWCSSAPGHGEDCEKGVVVWRKGRRGGEGVGCRGPDSADCRKLYPLISPATPRDKGPQGENPIRKYFTER